MAAPRVDDEHILALADAFQAAAVGAGSWYDALAALAHATGSRSGQLVGLGPEIVQPFNMVTDVGPEWAGEFFASGGGDPTRNPLIRAGAEAPVLREVASAEIYARQGVDARRNDFINWHQDRYDLHGICLTPLLKGEGIHVGVAVMRSQKQGEITGAQRRIFSTVAPHVRAAVRTQMALEHQGAMLIAGAMEALAQAVFVCDAKGVVRSMTPSAEALVAAGGPLSLHHGRLKSTLPAESAAIAKALDAALQPPAKPMPPAARTLAVCGRACQPLALEIVPLPKREHAFGFEPRALVVVRGVKRSVEQTREVLCSTFDLTPTEAAVAVCLAEGQAPKVIAFGRGVSVDTVRTQIRAIYAKVGVNRLNELIARINALR